MARRAALLQPPDIPPAAGAWAWPHRPRFWRPRHHHAELELNLVTAGRATFEVGGRVCQAASGDLLWFSPGVDHLLVSASDDFDMWVVALRPQLVDAVRRSVPLDPLAGLLDSGVRWSVAPAVLCAVADRAAAVGRAVADSAVLADALVIAAAACTARPSDGDRCPPSVRRALALLRAQPDLRRQELAEAAGASPSLLAHRFRRSVGLSIAEYRARVRLHRFVALLDDRRPNLLAAAEAAGFGSYAQFHRLVRATTGRAPRELLDPAARAALMQAVLDRAG